MAHFAFPPRASFRKGDRISCGSAAILSDKSTDELADYVAKWHGHLTRWFGPRMDVAGKRVLVIGSQYGPEILWALRNGAHEVVGLDPENCSSDALLLALDRLGLGERRDAFRMVAATTHEAGDIGTFDYVMSNNVFEHVEALSHTLRSTARFLPDPGGAPHHLRRSALPVVAGPPHAPGCVGASDKKPGGDPGDRPAATI